MGYLFTYDKLLFFSCTFLNLRVLSSSSFHRHTLCTTVSGGDFLFHRYTPFASGSEESMPPGGAQFILVLQREMINQLPPRCCILNEKLIVIQLVNKISALMVLEYPLLCSQKSATGPCSGYDQSNPSLNTLFLRA